jgi:hypothetical protein
MARPETQLEARDHTGRGHGQAIVRSSAATLLLLLLAVGSLMLWTAVPAAGLWAASKLTVTKAQHFVVGLPMTLSAMILWGVILFSLNAAYVRLTSHPATDDQAEDSPPSQRGPLEAFLVPSLLIACIAFLVWFFAFAKNPPPGIGL